MQRSFAAFILAILTSLAFASITPIEKKSEQSALYREILDRLATRHYHGQEINDELSERYLNQYLESLDPTKSYFLQSDINFFSQWSTKLDDLARRGDVEPGFIMFNRLRERAVQQLNHNIALLESDFQFDYTKDEFINLDVDSRDWFSTETEAKDYWRKRIKDQMIRLLLNDKDEQKARELLVKRFQNQVTQLKQRNNQDVFQLYMNALASLYDPHTAYLAPRTSENFQISMSLSLEGIGAVLQIEDEYTKVVRVVPGGPADLQGILKAEDKIIGVAQGEKEIVDVVGWRLDDVVDLIRGPKDSSVRLQILPSSGESAGKMSEITIVRDRVKLEDQSAKSRILDIENNGYQYKLGVIEIPTFYLDFDAYRARDPDYKSTSRDVYNLLQELKEQQVDGIVLDLRNNGGGALHEATMLTDLFINRGPVVQIRHANQHVYRNQRATMQATYDGPLLVMINRLSASASEIFAGAMQDYGRALIVGSQSFGKGTVQDVAGLTNGQLKLTVSKFYRVSGDSTQHRGVVPDIEFPSAYNFDEVGESHQENALPWDKIHAVPYKRFNNLDQYIAPLLARHQQRANSDPDYAHMTDRLMLNDEWDSLQRLSLNLEERKNRNTAWDEQLLLLENERLTAKGIEPFPDVPTWKKERKLDEENIRESDPMLYEAGYILTDLLNINTGQQQIVKIDSADAK